MIQIFDNSITSEVAELNKDLIAKVCENHANLDNRSPSWVGFDDSDPSNWSLHSKEDQGIIDEYLTKIIKPLSLNLQPAASGAEWWCNMNNSLGWHIDKDETLNKQSNEIRCPLLSTVFYPKIDCSGGELLLLDRDAGVEIQERAEQFSPEYDPELISRIIRIPPKENRLIVFSPGIAHRINPFNGTRYSLAVNIWEEKPLINHE